MSIATQIEALAADRTAIQSAISTKGGTVTSADGFDDFATAIGTIPSGGGSENVYLYKDGTISTEAGDFLNRSSGAGVFTKAADHMEFRATGTSAGARAIIHSQNAIDLTGYKYIVFDGVRSSGSSSYSNTFGICAATDIENEAYEISAQFYTAAETPTIVAIDVSGVNTAKHIKMHCGTSGNVPCKVYRILMIPED